MVAPPSFLQAVQVVVEDGAALPGGAVDALQLGPVLVTAPVGPGGAQQLERGQPPRGREVGAAAQVHELAVAVQGHPHAFGELRLVHRLDDLPLERLVGEDAQRLLFGDHLPIEGLIGGHDLGHPCLDRLQVLGGESPADVEVVVEAVLDGRPDGIASTREQGEHRLRHDVGGRVAQDVAARVAVGSDHLHGSAVGQRGRQVAQLPIDLDGHRRLGQARSDGAGRVAACGPIGEVQGGSIGKVDRDGHSCSLRRVRRRVITPGRPPGALPRKGKSSVGGPRRPSLRPAYRARSGSDGTDTGGAGTAAVSASRLVPLSRLVWETEGTDLPCPWCYTQTGEDDPLCPGCGRRFG